MIRRLLVHGIAVAVVLAATFAPAPARADPLDWAVPGGRFFTQTGGYAVVDRDGVPFWSEFQRLGGVQGVGYPVSQRFEWDGFVVQAMQRVIFQWQPATGQVSFVNVFDLLTEAGKDDWLLAVRQTPKPLPPEFDAGKPWGEVLQTRLALLDENPAIKRQYYSVAGDPIAMNGLPTSRVTDMGNNYTIRAQRVVIQQWKIDVPWAKAGQVTVALGGDIAKEAGLLPREAIIPTVEAVPPTPEAITPTPEAITPTPEAVTPTPATATPTPDATTPTASENAILSQINAYRLAAGVAPAQVNQALLTAAEGHVAYYDLNEGDPALAGMGLHQQQPGAPGFTGASFDDRARAAGYSGTAVTENAGFGGLEFAIEWAMNTVNHRLPLIHPSALDMGFAESSESGFNIVDVGMTLEAVTIPLPSVYPADGATAVPRSWDGGEAPNPAPGIPRPLGYPLTVAFALPQHVEWTSFQLAGPNNQPLAISSPIKSWMNAAAIIPHQPLKPETTYTATVTATVDGEPVTKTWRFTTAP